MEKDFAGRRLGEHLQNFYMNGFFNTNFQGIPSSNSYCDLIPLLTPPNPVQISASPQTRNVTVGSPFVIYVTANSTTDAFNAIQATATVSGNLSINSLLLYSLYL